MINERNMMKHYKVFKSAHKIKLNFSYTFNTSSTFRQFQQNKWRIA